MRNLTKTLAVVSLLASTSGHTLGIGEIKLNSALNQNLDAEISLTLSGESLSDIKVNLAPPGKFDEAGVSWTSFLSKIKFETIAHSNNAATIKLTSREALTEPFLDFLLEVSWPKGNLYREITVLVDPPSVYKPTPSPDLTVADTYQQAPVATLQRQSHANAQSTEGQYGPTLGNDTLWSVAERVRGENDVSVEQMMIALYEANPQAFYKGNVHALMAGKMLRIPQSEELLKLSRNQALAEFNRHTKAWRNRSAPVHFEAAKEKPVSSKAETPVDNQLTLVAPTTEAVEGNAAVASVNEQPSPEHKAAKASQETVNSKSAQGVAEGGKESASDEGAEGDAIQSRVAALEKQLAMMQELIALKDQQLAALQNQSQVSPAVQEPAAPHEVVAPKPVEQAKQLPQPAAAPPIQPPKPAQPAAQAKHESSAFPDLYYLSVGGIGTAVLSLLGWLWWRKRKVDQETNTESMFASSNIAEVAKADENISVPVVEDGVVHDTGIVTESSFLSEFTPSDFDSFDTDQGEIDPISEADVYLAYGRYQQAEELIRQAISDQPNRDECKLKLLEIFYANENKAAFEAYANELAEIGKRNDGGFWEQAAEMGREICPGSPLFSSGELGSGNVVKDAADSNNNVLDFDLMSSEVEEDSSVEDQLRNNQDINFDLSSFSIDNEPVEAEQGVTASSVVLSKTQVVQAEDIASIEADEGVASSDTFTGESSTDLDETEKTVADSSSATHVEALDFDLSSFSMDANEADDDIELSSAEAAQPSADHIETFDFDLSSFATDANEADENVAASGAEPVQASSADIETLDFDLSSFAMDDSDADDSKAASAQSSAMHVEELDFDLSSFNVKDSGAVDEDVTKAGALSDISSQTPTANKAQAFEAHEFDFNASSAKAEESDDLNFSALESDDKEYPIIDLSEDELSLDDDFDLNFDLDALSVKSGQSSAQYDEFGVSDLTDMDELETKLDLAKAYVDMGDADAAKDIAKEVLEQGTDEQKKIAKALLDELS